MSRRGSLWAFVATGLLVVVLLAFLVAPHASSKPDGLEKVGADKGLDTGVRVRAMAGGPLADYSVKGVHDNGLSTGMAGVIGVTITFGAAFGLSKIAKASRSRVRAQNTAA